ncbi:MAG: hypothetical protein P8179_25535 [Candidatus Thiodiazotropha sp.]
MKIQNNQFANASLNRQGLTAETNQVTPQSDTPGSWRFSIGERTGRPAGKLSSTVERTIGGARKNFSESKQAPLSFGQRMTQEFSSLQEATAQARNFEGFNESGGAAVVKEHGHYVIYQLQKTSWLSPSFDIDLLAPDACAVGSSTGCASFQSADPAIKALVSEDQYVAYLTDSSTGNAGLSVPCAI